MAGESLETRMAVLEDRHQGLKEKVDDIHETINGLTKGAWGLAIAIAGWALVTLYHATMLRMSAGH